LNVEVNLRVGRIEIWECLLNLGDGSLLFVVKTLNEERFGDLGLLDGVLFFYLLNLLELLSQCFIARIKLDGLLDLQDGILVLMQFC